MESTNKSKLVLNSDNPSDYMESTDSQQVRAKKSYTPRRSFDTAYKLRILAAYDACETTSARGALLRKEGLYHSRIAAWKQQQKNANEKNKKSLRGTKRNDHLAREVAQLKKKLAHAEAIIDLQKKISELLGVKPLEPEDNEPEA